MTADDGTSLAWTDYQPFGEIRSAGVGGSAPDVRFGCTGQYLDAATGLYHLRARQYDPGVGRFLSTDPVAAPISDPYVAAYVYVGANPGRYVDPSGRCLQFLLFGFATAPASGGAGAGAGAWATLACATLAAGEVLLASAGAWVAGSAIGGALADATSESRGDSVRDPRAGDPYPQPAPPPVLAPGRTPDSGPFYNLVALAAVYTAVNTLGGPEGEYGGAGTYTRRIGAVPK